MGRPGSMNGTYTMPLNDVDIEAIYLEMEKNPLLGRRGRRKLSETKAPGTGRLRTDNFNREYTSRGEKCQTINSL